MVVATDGVIENVNRWISERCGRSSTELIGQNVVGGLLEGIPKLSELTGTPPMEAMLRVADGTLIPIEVVGQPVRSSLQGNEVYTIRDLTERRRSDAQIAYLAHHDGLSGLPNRGLLKEQDQAGAYRRCPWHKPRRGLSQHRWLQGRQYSLRTSVGDALLQSVAKRLRKMVRAPNFAARLGADEFAVVQTRAQRKQQTVELSGRLLSELCKPYRMLGEEHYRRRKHWHHDGTR